ncbi:hypothetical protein F5Y02DRAFT_408818 [Annulohypoxylon stygium]|nr:hypothetical protein F5Y02DRAFT_408818 [Annulohypoxylon stygium]
MASILSYVPIVNRLVPSNSQTRTIDIPPVEVHNVETAPEKRPRTLKHLLKANHVNHSIIYHNLEFHNHMPHILGSAYLLGAQVDHLHKIYDVEAQELEAWTPSPAEITQDDWKDFLGYPEYQRAYVDFFEDALVLRHNYQWKDVVKEYIYEGHEPLINGLFSGLGHPLIHLGYAYELDNREIAMEAVGMAATQYDFLHKYIDDSSYSKPSPIKSSSPLELFHKLAGDKRLNGAFKSSGPENIAPLFHKHEEVVLEYWNAWNLEDPVKDFQLSQEVAVAAVIATVPNGTHSYNFYTCHILTTSHAVRILLPFIPPEHRINLVRAWWLFAIAVYVAVLRPKIDPDYIGDGGQTQWDYVEKKALNGSYATDAHFVKVVRAIKEAARTWGDVHNRYLNSAIRFVDDFQGWRRRRNIVQASSDDEEETKPKTNVLSQYLFSSPEQRNTTAGVSRATPTSPSPVRKQSRLLASQPPKPKSTSKSLQPSNNGLKSASTSPEKPKTRSFTKGKRGEKDKSADLVTMFSRQAQRAPTISPIKRDDIMSDPISDDDDVGENIAASSSRVGQNSRKRFRDSSQSSQPAAGPVLISSQKFLKPPRPQQGLVANDEQRPWSERFAPVNLEELAVHKKKVADVRRWLEDVMAGAAGTGKTTTVQLLAKDMHCELLEWRNPVGSLGANQGFQSISAQFEEFMGRGGKFGQLDIDFDSTPSSSSLFKSDINENTRKIILIEEFPNTFTRSSTALTSFRQTILRYLATNTPSLATFGRQTSSEPITPVVMVISETLLTTTSASADSFTAHRLLGPEITRHPGCCVIDALELIVQKEARKSGRRREIGDIRSDTGDWGSKVTFTKPKRGSKNELVSQREASLGIFHAVGKVVYNKRDERPMSQQTPEGQAEMLPDFMSHLSRPKRSEVSVDSLIDETGTDTHTFISALHENYVLSCEATGPSDPNSSLDYISNCIDNLSDSDILSPSWDSFFRGRGAATSAFSGRDSASHVLRQDEITFQVATRGLLFSLPNPVKRMSKTHGRGGGDAYKMFYPTSLRLWREKEELEGVVDHWASKLLKGDEAGQDLTQGASAFRRPKSVSGCGEWINKHQTPRRNNSQAKQADPSQDQSAPLLFLGSSARRELLLERLPYMAHIARGRRNSIGLARMREIEKVTSFSGIGDVAADDDALDGDENAELNGEAWATDKPTEEGSPRKKRVVGIGFRQKKDADIGSTAAVSAIQKLVLSDDDIED